MISFYTFCNFIVGDFIGVDGKNVTEVWDFISHSRDKKTFPEVRVHLLTKNV
jgi:hypothetical protein